MFEPNRSRLLERPAIWPDCVQPLPVHVELKGHSPLKNLFER
jgi:hypothetical protein